MFRNIDSQLPISLKQSSYQWIISYSGSVFFWIFLGFLLDPQKRKEARTVPDLVCLHAVFFHVSEWVPEQKNATKILTFEVPEKSVTLSSYTRWAPGSIDGSKLTKNSVVHW